jgi:hypothetical protein
MQVQFGKKGRSFNPVSREKIPAAAKSVQSTEYLAVSAGHEYARMRGRSPRTALAPARVRAPAREGAAKERICGPMLLKMGLRR